MAKLNLDMTNVQDGFQTVDEGDYIIKVMKVELKDGAKAKYLSWEFTIGTGPFKGQKLFNNTSLAPNALFNLRNFLMACGLEVPKSVMTLDTDKVIGKVVGVTVKHEEYQGKMKARCDEFWRAVKTERGWTRAQEAAVAKVTAPNKAVTTPVSQEEDEDLPFDSASDDGEVEGVEI